MKRLAVCLTLVAVSALACNFGARPTEVPVSPTAAMTQTPPPTASPAPTEASATMPPPTLADTQTPPTEPPLAPTAELPASPSPAPGTAASPLNPNPPAGPVKLIFIHHSSGENWLADDNGGLGLALMQNNYFVSDTNYDWGPTDPELGDKIGSHTDTGNWWNWFLGPNRGRVLAAVFTESQPHAAYTRLDQDPGGENQIVMFKSCFPNSALGGNPDDLPAAGPNPLYGQDASSDAQTVANAKGIYRDLLKYFATRPDKLFVAVTAPPLFESDTSPEQAANARAFNLWLVQDWLRGYTQNNVAVFDFYNVLTSNGGDIEHNDLGAATGNHHRFRNGVIEYVTGQGLNTSAYAVAGDSHAKPAGNQKATGEFVALLNIFYHRWRGK
jgi:hypothetical protein